MNLYVGNLVKEVTQDDLMQAFGAFGQVASAMVIRDKFSGESRGFAFVEMPNDEEAAKAIAALDGKEVNGRNLKVNEARPKTERSGPRSCGGAGGGRGRGGFSNEDYSTAARQPREPRW